VNRSIIRNKKTQLLQWIHDKMLVLVLTDRLLICCRRLSGRWREILQPTKLLRFSSLTSTNT